MRIHIVSKDTTKHALLVDILSSVGINVTFGSNIEGADYVMYPSSDGLVPLTIEDGQSIKDMINEAKDCIDTCNTEL